MAAASAGTALRGLRVLTRVEQRRSSMAGCSAHEDETLLEKKSLNKADREEILKKFYMVMMQVKQNVPFMLEQFEEATGKVVTHAKAEVDAFMTHNVMSEGLRALADKIGEKEPPKLPGESGG